MKPQAVVLACALSLFAAHASFANVFARRNAAQSQPAAKQLKTSNFEGSLGDAVFAALEGFKTEKDEDDAEIYQYRHASSVVCTRTEKAEFATDGTKSLKKSYNCKFQDRDSAKTIELNGSRARRFMHKMDSPQLVASGTADAHIETSYAQDMECIHDAVKEMGGQRGDEVTECVFQTVTAGAPASKN